MKRIAVLFAGAIMFSINALLEKIYTVSGELNELALKVVFRVAENQVDIMHAQCVWEGRGD